jgi:hypothetical protein
LIIEDSCFTNASFLSSIFAEEKKMDDFRSDLARVSHVRAWKTRKKYVIVYSPLSFIEKIEHHELPVYEFCLQLIAHTFWRIESGRE